MLLPFPGGGVQPPTPSAAAAAARQVLEWHHCCLHGDVFGVSCAAVWGGNVQGSWTGMSDVPSYSIASPAAAAAGSVALVQGVPQGLGCLWCVGAAVLPSAWLAAAAGAAAVAVGVEPVKEVNASWQ